MSEEVQEEQEEITLTEDDLAVIDEVEQIHDEESGEIENTESVEASAEPETSSDEVSTAEPTGQTFNPDLVARAGVYGLDPTGFASEQALQYVVQQFDQGNQTLSEWNNWYQGQVQQQTAQTAESYRTQQPQFKVDLSEDYDEGLRTAIDQMASNMQAHYDQQLDIIAQSVLDQQSRIAYQQQYVSQAEAYQQQQLAAGELDQFNNAVSKLGDQTIFGDKSYQETEPGSEQAQNMERLFDQVNVLEAGYASQGMQIPAKEQLVEQAYHTMFGKEISKQYRSRFNERAKRQSKRRLGSGASTAAINQPAEDVDELVNSNVLKDFYDKAIEENGS